MQYMNQEYMRKFNESLDRILNSPLPDPDIFDGGDPNWNDNFVRIEFTTHYNNTEHRWIYKRADGWLYNIQTNPQGRKFMQFMNPVNPVTHFGHARTGWFFFDEIAHSVLVLATAKPTDITEQPSNVASPCP